MSSQTECLSQKTAFRTAGSLKPIEVSQQALARVAQIMGTMGQDNKSVPSNAENSRTDWTNEFDGDEVDDDLVFSTVPQRPSTPTAAAIHFDEIDDDEMRRFAESFEQEQQQDSKMDNDDEDERIDDEPLCQENSVKMQTPTNAEQIESMDSNSKRKPPCIEDLDALLNDDDEIDEKTMEQQQFEQPQQQQMSPVFKKKL